MNANLPDLPTGLAVLIGIAALFLMLKAGKFFMKLLFFLFAAGVLAAAFWWHTHKGGQSRRANKVVITLFSNPHEHNPTSGTRTPAATPRRLAATLPDCAGVGRRFPRGCRGGGGKRDHRAGASARGDLAGVSSHGLQAGQGTRGVEVDLARALAEKLGRKVIFVELDWKDQIEALIAGKTDIIMSSMSVMLARRSIIQFTHPYLKVGQMALVRREDKHWHSLGWKIPAGTKVGVIKATTGDFLVQREFPKAKRKTYESGTDASAISVKRIRDRTCSPPSVALIGVQDPDSAPDNTIPKHLS